MSGIFRSSVMKCLVLLSLVAESFSYMLKVISFLKTTTGLYCALILLNLANILLKKIPAFSPMAQPPSPDSYNSSHTPI